MHGTFKSELGTLLNFALSSAMADPGALIELNAGAGWRPKVGTSGGSANIEFQQATRFAFVFLVADSHPTHQAQVRFLELRAQDISWHWCERTWAPNLWETFVWENYPIAIVPKSVSWKMTRHLDARNRLLKKREWSAQCCPWCLGCRVWISWTCFRTCFAALRFSVFTLSASILPHSVGKHLALVRCPLAACCELLLPIAVLALLWWAKSECNGSWAKRQLICMRYYEDSHLVLAFAVIVEFVKAISWLQRMACPAILWDVQGTGQCELPVLEGWGGRMPEKNKSTTCVEGRLGKAWFRATRSF